MADPTASDILRATASERARSATAAELRAGMHGSGAGHNPHMAAEYRAAEAKALEDARVYRLQESALIAGANALGGR